MNDDNQKSVSPERLVRVETQVAQQAETLNRMSSKLTDVDETLQAIGQHLAQISARPEAKGFSEQIKTISTTASVVLALCGSVWWAISINTNPLVAQISVLQAENVKVIEDRVHMEYTIKRLEKLDGISIP